MLANPNFYRVLSDAILVIHFTFVAVVVGGFVLIWAGYFGGWLWVRNFRFRLAHLCAMGFVLFEAIIGMTCPLTTWENQLRLRAGEGRPYEESFIAHWFGRILFYDLGEQAFAILYGGFFVLIVLTLWFVPPRWPRRCSKRDLA